MRFADQGERCEALQDCGGCYAGLEARGDDVCFGCGCGGVFCVGSCSEPDYAIAYFEVEKIAAGAEGDDCAFCFTAEDFGFGGWVETGAEIPGECQYCAVLELLTS